jgi:hypothetical protein
MVTFAFCLGAGNQVNAKSNESRKEQKRFLHSYNSNHPEYLSLVHSGDAFY